MQAAKQTFFWQYFLKERRLKIDEIKKKKTNPTPLYCVKLKWKTG